MRQGESYLVSLHGEMLSESRFEHDISSLSYFENQKNSKQLTVLKDPLINVTSSPDTIIDTLQLPYTFMANHLLNNAQTNDNTLLLNKNASSNVLGYNDYRGIKVYGAWLWDDKLGFWHSH